MATNYFGDDKDATITNASFTGKVQKINLDDEKVLDPNESERLVSGDINSATKSTIVGGKDVIGGGANGTLASHTLGSDTIVGDAVELNASTFTGGADKITLAGIKDTDATVVGDAISVSGGTTRGGNDTIIVEGDVNGGTIIGDVESVTNTTFTAGNDNIQLKGDVANAAIYTDAKEYSGANTLSGGNDIVTLGVKPASGQEVTTSVADSFIDLGHGTNTLTAYSTLHDIELRGGTGVDKLTLQVVESNSRIDTGHGNDSIVVHTVQDDSDGGYSEVHGGAGRDTIKVTTLIESNVLGGDDNDTITVDTAQYGLIDGDAGNDTITVGRLEVDDDNNESEILGGDGNDSIGVTTVVNSSIDGNDGDDKITVTNLTSKSFVDGGDGHDSIIVTTVTDGNVDGDDNNDTIKVTTVTDGNINGGEGTDSITVTNLNGGSVDGGEGTDSITVTNFNGGSLYGGAQNDNIKVINFNGGTVDAGSEDDNITVTTANGSTITGDSGDDTINVTTAKEASAISGGTGDDSIKVTTVTASTIDGDAGNDSLTITTLQASTIKNGKVTEVDKVSKLSGGDGDDSISIVTVNNSSVFGDAGNDSVKITNILGESSIDLGEGNDSLFVSSNKSTNLDDTALANSLGVGDDTLSVNWAFNGTFTSSETPSATEGDPATPDNDTLITKGLGANANLVFGDGHDNLTISGAASGNKSGLSDTQLAESLGAGQDTLNVGWAFNGIFNTSDDEGGTLITKGLNASSTLQFGAGNDGLEVIGALSNRQINTLEGDDTVSISGAATNVEVDLGTGADVFSVGSVGKGTSLRYTTDGLDDITIKGTYNDGFVEAVHLDAVDQSVTGTFIGLSTGDDGGSITLDTLGTGQLEFGDGDDTITINKNVAGTATVKKEISTLAGDDSIDLKGTVTNAIVDAGFGADTVSIGALGTGSTLKYTADGVDHITVKGTYNTGFAQSIFTDEDSGAVIGAFHGLATGSDGGAITLDTLGTGKLQFGDGADSLTINKALSGSLGLKDIFMQAGDDSVTLNTVNGVVISGGSDNDYISATGLGATGELRGDGGNDTIQIGREFTDADSFKATATMNNGVINGGDGDDSIIIGNTLDADSDGSTEDIKGTLSGGKVYGGDGDDAIVTTTLSGSGLMDGGLGNDKFIITNMSGGTISGGDDNDTIFIVGTFSRGTINGGDGNDIINIFNPTSATATSSMSGGTINGGAGKDTIAIQNLKGGVINTNDDAGADSIIIDTMTGGTINSGAGDEIEVTTMTKGTINGNAGDDRLGVLGTMNGGAINGQDGNDFLIAGIMNGGTLNAGEGNNTISIGGALNGGSILAGAGNDTLILLQDIVLSGKYTINLGAGDNEIQVGSDLDGQSLVLGASHDNVIIKGASNAKINLGSGNDTISSERTENTIIDGNSGNDSIDIDTANAGTFVYAGAGNDTIEIAEAIDAVIDAGTGSDVIDVSDLQGTSFITHDTAGQDTLILSNYVEGMVVGAGGKNEINTGTDGGKIELDTWTSGDITFGNGHDAFVLHDATGLNKSIDLKSGNDSVTIEGFGADGKVYYNSTGFDSITINATYDGTKVYQSINSKGEDVGGLTTGTDGGFIHVIKLTAEGADALSFSTKNDHFSIDALDVDGKTIDLKTGTDSITVSFLVNGIIKYDSTGFDSISIHGNYNGYGISSVQGSDTVDKGLTTGTDGGFIHVDSLGVNVATGDVSFSDKNDHFSIGTLDNAGLEIDLKLGTDSITAQTLTNGTITYNNAGFDSITITGAYVGTGIKDQDGKLGTGADGGFMSIGSISTEAGVDGLAFSAKSDTFEIGTLNVDGLDESAAEIGSDTINLGAGNDSVTVSTLIDGTIDLGDGNDKFSATDKIMGGTVDAGNGNDSINVSHMDGGFVVAGLGNDSLSLGAVSGNVFGDAERVHLTANYTGSIDKITIESLDGSARIYGDFSQAEVYGDDVGKFTIKGGNDVITVNGDINGDSSKVFIRGDGESIANAKTFTAGNDNITLKGNVNNVNISGDLSGLASQDITFNGGIDTITLGIKGQEGQTLVTNTIIGLEYGNDVFNAYSTLGAGVAIYGGDGNDKFTINTMTDGTVNGDNPLNSSDEGNDAFFITNMTGGTTDGGVGNDVFTLKNFASGTAIGNDGNDKFTITTMTGGTVYGDDTANTLKGNDTINITTTATGGIIVGGEAIETQNSRGVSSYGADSIVIKNATDLTIYGDYDDITIDEKVDDTTVSYNDIIKVTGIAENTGIKGNYGNDSITVATMNGGFIDGGAGDDSITISTSRDSEISGGSGDDTIKITTGIGDDVNGGFDLYGDAGNDAITMTTLNRGNIYGGSGVDTITVKNAYGSFIGGFDDGGGAPTEGDIIKVTGLAEDTDIVGAAGADAITVGSATAGSSIYGDAGNDTIRVTTLTDSIIDGGAGLDEIYVTNQLKSEITFSNDNNTTDIESDKILLSGGIGYGANVTLLGSDGFDVAKSYNIKTGVYTGFNMSGGYLSGSDGIDNIYLGTFSGGQINTGLDADTITVANAINKTVNITNTVDSDPDTVDSDTLYLTKGISAGANITLQGDGGFVVAKNANGDGFAMTGGTLLGSAGADNFTLASMTGGALNGGWGNDIFNITLNGASKGILYGGAGDDVYNLDATKKSSITINDFSGGDSIIIGSDTITAADVVGLDSITSGDITINLGTVQVDPDKDKLEFDNISDKFIYGTPDADTITISGTATKSGIFGLDGADSISVGTLSSSQILSASGADTITVGTVNGGYIDGGADADLITITNQVKKAISIANSGSETDSLYLSGGIGSGGNVELQGVGGGFVVAQSVDAIDPAKPLYTGFNLTSGTLTGSDEADVFYIDKMSSGTLSGEGGKDTFNIITLNGGVVNGGADADSINIGIMTGGTVDGGMGEDTTAFFTTVNKTIRINNSGTESDHVYLDENLAKGGNVILTSNTGFQVSTSTGRGFDMAAGTITGSAGSDSIYIDTLTSGTINANAGDDYIAIDTKVAGTVNGGTGEDTLIIIGEVSSEQKLSALASNVEYFRFNNLVASGSIVGTNGNDNITLNNMSGGAINAGAGYDSITLDRLPTDGSIDGGEGSDTFKFDGVLDSAVGLDTLANNVEVFEFLQLVNNGIINGTAEADNISVDVMNSGSIDAGAGDDIIIVNDVFTGGSIDGGEGDDTLYFNGVTSAEVDLSLISNVENIIFNEVTTNGTVTGSDKADTITIESMTGGAVNTGLENDKIILKTLPSAGTIDGGDGQDTLQLAMELNSAVGLDTLATDVEKFVFSNIIDGGSVTGTAEADDIIIEAMSGGSVNTGVGADTITLKSLPTGGIIDGGEGEDKLSLDVTVDGELDLGSLAISIERFDLNDVTTNANIIGTDNADSISITTMSGGSINAGLGDDTVTLHSIPTGGTLEGGEGEDVLTFGSAITINTTADLNALSSGFESFTFEQLTTNGNIIGTDKNDYINVLNMNGGEINSGAGYDTIIVANAITGGTIDAGAGEDSIEIRNMPTVGTINGGAGMDTLFMDITVNTEVDFDSLVDGVEVYHVNELVDGGHIMGNDNIGSNNIVVNIMEGGTITLSNTLDFITINSIPTGGLIEGGTNYDSLYLNTTIDGAVDLGTLTTDIEEFEFEGLAAGGMITGTSDNERFILNTVPTGGVIDGVSGFDILRINTSIDGVVNFDAISNNINDFYMDDIVENANITGTGSADQITVQNNMSGGTLNAGAGDDHIIISKSFTGGFIDGGEGIDTLELLQGISTELNLATQTDNIEIFTFDTLNSGGKIIGTDQNDEIQIDAINGGSVDGGAGVDTLSIRDDVNYELNLSTSTSNIDVFDFREVVAGGNVIGTDEGDDIQVYSMAGGIVNAGAGNDAIILSTIPIGGTIDGGEDYDILHFGTMPNSLTITGAVNLEALTENVEEFIFTELADGGSIAGTDDHDIIEVTTLSGGSINAGAGDDIILLNSVPASGSIDGGGGNEDRLELYVTISEALTLSTLATNVEHFQFMKIAAGGSITGTALDDNIVIAGDMTGGSISTGGGADIVTLYFIPTGGTIDGGEGNEDRLELDVTISEALTLSDLAINVEHFQFEGIAAGGSITGTALGDNIVIAGSMTGGTITAGAGDDFIILRNTPTGGSVNGGAGEDTLWISDVDGAVGLDTLANEVEVLEFVSVLENGVITGTADDDRITVHEMSAGEVHLGAGNDTITLKSIPTGGTINGGDDGDTLWLDMNLNSAVGLDTIAEHVEHFVFNNIIDGGSVTGTAEADYIIINAMSGGSVNTGVGADTVNIITMQKGSINLGAGDDALHIDKITGTLNGGDGFDILYSDTVTITKATQLSTIKSQTTNFEGFGFGGIEAGGTLIGTADADYISVANMTGGSISTGGGADSISLSNVPTGGTIDGGDGTDILDIKGTITNNLDLGVLTSGIERFEFGTLAADASYARGIYGTTEGETIVVDHMISGRVSANEGDDVIEVSSILSGQVYGDEGADSITVEISSQTTNAWIDGGAGADEIRIAGEGEINISGFSADVENDRLFINGTDVTENLTGEASYTFDGITIYFGD